jgi:ribonuclease BN (tRNA processing enzyme)
LANPFTRAFDPVEMKAEQPVYLGGMAVIPYEVRHTLPAFGYRVEGAASSFGYSGDTGLCPGLTKLAEGVNLLLCEATAREEGALTASAGHLTARQAGEVASEANSQILVLTHLSRQDPEWVAGLLEDAHEVFDGSVGVGSTHLRLSVPEIPYVPTRAAKPLLVEP